MSLTHGGGKPNVKPCDYSEPKGPIGINDRKGPGLHGDNHGNDQKSHAGRGSGSVGLHGTNKGNDGSQR